MTPTLLRKRTFDLNSAWKTYTQFQTKSKQLLVESDHIDDRVYKLQRECERLQEKSARLFEKSNKVYVKSSHLWRTAVLKSRGNIRMEWKKNGDCHLETGEVFKMKP